MIKRTLIVLLSALAVVFVPYRVGKFAMINTFSTPIDFDGIILFTAWMLGVLSITALAGLCGFLLAIGSDLINYIKHGKL